MNGMTPKKSLGQHWLNDPASLQAMCEAAKVEADDYVLEIGPGQGTLTQKLLGRDAQVLALEFDRELIPALRIKLGGTPNQRFSVEQGDIRTYDLGTLPDTYKIVSNIPYYLTANLVRLLTEEHTHKPVMASLLMQKEVAERLAAQPGDMAFISVMVQLYYEVSLGALVPARLFIPPPKVDSQILIMRKHPQPLFNIDTKIFNQLLKAGFSQRRKTLLNSLSSGLHLDKTAVTKACQTAQVAPGRRPQTLTLEEWYNLYLVLNT